MGNGLCGASKKNVAQTSKLTKKEKVALVIHVESLAWMPFLLDPNDNGNHSNFSITIKSALPPMEPQFIQKDFQASANRFMVEIAHTLTFAPLSQRDFPHTDLLFEILIHYLNNETGPQSAKASGKFSLRNLNERPQHESLSILHEKTNQIDGVLNFYWTLVPKDEQEPAAINTFFDYRIIFRPFKSLHNHPVCSFRSYLEKDITFFTKNNAIVVGCLGLKKSGKTFLTYQVFGNPRNPLAYEETHDVRAKMAKVHDMDDSQEKKLLWLDLPGLKPRPGYKTFELDMIYKAIIEASNALVLLCNDIDSEFLGLLQAVAELTRAKSRKTLVILHNYCKMDNVNGIENRIKNDIKKLFGGNEFVMEVMRWDKRIPTTYWKSTLKLCSGFPLTINHFVLYNSGSEEAKAFNDASAKALLTFLSTLPVISYDLPAVIQGNMIKTLNRYGNCSFLLKPEHFAISAEEINLRQPKFSFQPNETSQNIEDLLIQDAMEFVGEPAHEILVVNGSDFVPLDDILEGHSFLDLFIPLPGESINYDIKIQKSQRGPEIIIQVDVINRGENKSLMPQRLFTIPPEMKLLNPRQEPHQVYGSLLYKGEMFHGSHILLEIDRPSPDKKSAQMMVRPPVNGIQSPQQTLGNLIALSSLKDFEKGAVTLTSFSKDQAPFQKCVGMIGEFSDQIQWAETIFQAQGVSEYVRSTPGIFSQLTLGKDLLLFSNLPPKGNLPSDAMITGQALDISTTREFLQNFVIHNSQVIIYIVKEMTYSHIGTLNLITREHPNKILIVIYNWEELDGGSLLYSRIYQQIFSNFLCEFLPLAPAQNPTLSQQVVDVKENGVHAAQENIDYPLNHYFKVRTSELIGKGAMYHIVNSKNSWRRVVRTIQTIIEHSAKTPEPKVFDFVREFKAFSMHELMKIFEIKADKELDVLVDKNKFKVYPSGLLNPFIKITIPYHLQETELGSLSVCTVIFHLTGAYEFEYQVDESDGNFYYLHITGMLSSFDELSPSRRPERRFDQTIKLFSKDRYSLSKSDTPIENTCNGEVKVSTYYTKQPDINSQVLTSTTSMKPVLQPPPKQKTELLIISDTRR